MTYATTSVPTGPGALHAAIQQSHPLAVTVCTPKALQRADMPALAMTGATIVPIPLCDRAPPGSLAGALAGFGPDLCWMAAATADPAAEVDLTTATPGDIKRFGSIATRWCKVLADAVPAERRLLDGRTQQFLEMAEAGRGGMQQRTHAAKQQRGRCRGTENSVAVC